ncbi:MAG: GntR family transcriptional regulator [Spirochaetales bacterium]|nr:GntR family transcriptional regulator [Spirochaetales bacterium]
MYLVKNEDLSEKAYEAVKSMILQGKLKPGEKLYQEKMAETLGISRTPLNGALNKLEKEMLVEALPRRGFYVKKLSLKELKDLYDIRLRLEPLGARSAAESQHPILNEKCKELLETFSQIDDQNIPSEFKELDHKFHNLIMDMSSNIFLSKMISSYNIISLGNLQLFMDKEYFPKKTTDSLEEHKRILTAIINGEPQNAEKEMFSHIEGTRNLLAEQLEKQDGKA